MFLLKPKFVITLAIITGLLAAYGVYHYLKQQEARTSDSALPTFVSRKVVVAATDLPIGTTLTPVDVQVRMWPETLVPVGSFGEVEVLISRVLKTDVAAGEPILESKLAPEGSTGGFSSLIPTGMRAVTVAVNVVSGVGGFILPRTKVDVLVTVAMLGKPEERSTKTILQNVEVLAVDQTYEKDSDDPVQVKSVTLLVTPEQAEKLALAASEGVLQLALRSGADTDQISEGDGISIKELMSGPKPPPRPAQPRRQVSKPTPPPPETKVVEVYRANKLEEEVTFEEEEGSNGNNGSSEASRSRR